MATTAQHFRFFNLPAELRNEIYRFAFEGTLIMVNRRLKDKDLPSSAVQWDSNNKANLALLHANSQLRSEATPIFYATADFNFIHLGSLIKWMKVLEPKSKAMLKHVCVRVYDKESDLDFLQHIGPIFLRALINYTKKMGAAWLGLEPARVRHELWDAKRDEKIDA